MNTGQRVTKVNNKGSGLHEGLHKKSTGPNWRKYTLLRILYGANIHDKAFIVGLTIGLGFAVANILDGD